MVKSSDAKQLRNWKVSSSTAFIPPMPFVPHLTSCWYFSLLGAAEVWPAATWWRRRRASWGRPGTRSGTSRWGWRRRTTRTRYSPHHQADSRHLISHSQLNIFLFLSVHRHKYYIEKDLWSYIEQFFPEKRLDRMLTVGSQCVQERLARSWPRPAPRAPCPRPGRRPSDWWPTSSRGRTRPAGGRDTRR